MMNLFKAFVVSLLFAAPLLAHHSLGTYDSTKPVTITGTVTKLDWRNPHVNVYLSVKSDDGKVITRLVQIAAVGRLTQLGLAKELFAIGATVTFETLLPKDPSYDVPLAGRTMMLPDGRHFDVRDIWWRMDKQ
jgi:hypothetical protein